MAGDSFWSLNVAPLHTVSAGEPAPYTILPGTPGAAVSPDPVIGDRYNPDIRTQAEARFSAPGTDLHNSLRQRPPTFSNPTAAEFMQWHSAHQVDYINSNTAIDTHPDVFVTVGGAVTAVLSEDGATPLIVERLQATDIARLSLKDQQSVAARDVFRTSIAPTYGLEPGLRYATSDAARDAMKDLVQQAVSVIETSASFVPDAVTLFRENPAARNPLYHYFFTEQLGLLTARLNQMAIFSPDQIGKEIDTLLDRFLRLERFRTQPEETSVLSSSSGPVALARNVNAVDGRDSLRAASDIFLQIEADLYDTAALSAALSTYGVFEGQLVDGANMVSLFQQFATYREEAEASGRIEEMNINRRLLDDYAQMQQLVNDTLAQFAESGIERNRLKLGEGGPANPLTQPASVQRLISMFDSALAPAAPENLHPREAEIGNARPTLDIVSDSGTLVEHERSAWEAFATALGEQTKLIGQNTEILMNEISNGNAQKNRNYELGSNVLNKLTEMLRFINA